MTTINTAPTFSQADGKVTTDFGSDEWGRSVIQQADGKLVVAGLSSGNDGFALARYNINGTLDASFGGDGTLTTDLGSFFDVGHSVIQQADGKLVMAGYANYDLALVRYNLDGTLDTGFGSDGKLTTDIGSYDTGGSVIQQADGKLVVTGKGGDDVVGHDFALIRYNLDGTLDTSFSGDGKLTTDMGSYNEGHSVIQQTDGKLVVAGTSSSGFALARYNADGTLDTSFSGDGKLTTDFSSSYDDAYSVIQQADGKLVVAGTSNGDFALVRYNADGTLDASFGSDGKLTTDSGVSSYDNAYSVIQQADGKLVVAGTSDSDFALVRYNTDGTLDTSFSGDGKLTTDFSSSYDDAYSVIQQADGKLVVAGRSGGGTPLNGNDFAWVRYNLDGSLDTTISSLSSHTPVFIENQPSWYPNTKAVLAPRVQVVDAELSVAGHYGNASITLSRHAGANPQDEFSGTGTLSALSEGSYFSVQNVTIGRVTMNSEGTLKLTFNSNATQNLVDEALQQIGYANTSDAPPASVKIGWLFNDGNTGTQGTGGALSVTGTSTVNITPANDAPISHGMLQEQTALANAAFSYALPTEAFRDPDLEPLNYGVSMDDGTGLLPWLTIDRVTGTLSGTPEMLDTGTFTLRITATDAAGATASDTFTLTVSAPSNVVDGTAGNDNLMGQSGNDVLNGYAGNDTLNGGQGADNMNGGDGADVYHVDDAGDVVVESNAASATGGIDTVYSDVSGYTLGANVENGRILSPGVASLSGNSLNNVLYAGAGNNTLDGQGGTDTVSYLYATAGVTVSLAATVEQDTESSGLDRLLNIENLTGSKYDDHLIGNAVANVLDGGLGADIMAGRNGNDTYYVNHADDVVSEALNGGTDTVYSSLAAYTLRSNVENGVIQGSVVGSLTGNGVANTLTGNAVANKLDGGAGNDKLDGKAGNDTLIGGTGNDTLMGGAGKDMLTGGAGNDVFDFNTLAESGITNATRDTITDFTRGQDKIDLSTLDANTTVAGNDAFKSLTVGGAFSGSFASAGDLYFDTVAKVLYGNTDADAAAEFSIQLNGITTLTTVDLIL